MVSARACVLLALAGCGGDAAVLAPVIDSPPAGSSADPLPGLEEVELQVAFAGDPDELVSAVFQSGQPLVLPGVPYEENLVVHLTGRRAGAEVAYGRTCSFDLLRGEAVPAPHLYFSRTVQWAAGATPVQSRRSSGLAFAAADGSAVFLAGHDETDTPLTAVDRFDARGGAFEDLTTVTPRLGGQLATLRDGSVVIIGGVDGLGQQVALVERIDPLATPLLRREEQQDDRLQMDGHAVASLSDGKVIVIGGRAPNPAPDGPIEVTGAVWQLSLSATGGLNPAQLIDATLLTPRSGHTLTRLSDDLGAPVLVVGGVDAAGVPVAAAELYQPLRFAFADAADFQAPLAFPRTRHAALRMPDGSVLVIGGVDGAGAPVLDLELFSRDGGGFTSAGKLPAGAGVVDFTVTALPDGRVLLAGGRESPAGPALASAYIISLDPLDGTVDLVKTADLGVARAGHHAVLLCDGTILVVGGTEEQAPGERYNPPSIGRR